MTRERRSFVLLGRPTEALEFYDSPIPRASVGGQVAVHEKGSSRWAAIPSRPRLKDDVAVRGDDGKVIYRQLFEFGTREVRDAFSRGVWRALLEFDPGAVPS